jgi:DNA-binding CsgD family transcriptional regulator
MVDAVMGPDIQAAPSVVTCARRQAPAVVGTAGADFVIERISRDAVALFTPPLAVILGSSLLDLVVRADRVKCFSALIAGSARQGGTTLLVELNAEVARSVLHCEIVLLSLLPAPSCAFVLVPVSAGEPPRPREASLSATLLRLGQEAGAVRYAPRFSRGLTERNLRGLRALTARESEIVTRLLEGDRVPAIAAKLFLSQSTVRNHLASVFAKLGVTSQQQLLDSFR